MTLKLIIHSGTPKTGTTSFQSWMFNHSELLAKNGIYYPRDVKSLSEPKHQWLASYLKNNEGIILKEKLNGIIQSAKNLNLNTIFLSSEGVYNYWYFMSTESKLLLKELNDHISIDIWTVFRKPNSYLLSLYKQNLENHQIPNNNLFGKNISFSQALENSWFRNQINYLGFINDIKSLGLNIKVFKYSDSVIHTLINQLGLPHNNHEKLKLNTSMSNRAYRLISEINKVPLSKDNKKEVLRHIEEIDRILKTNKDEEKLESEKDIMKIQRFFSEQRNELKHSFDLEW